MPGLSVNDIVNVSVNLQPIAAPTENFGSLLLLGSSSVIDVVQRIRQYASLAAVAADFGTSAQEYLAADAFYSQSPTPSTLNIGRWAQAATAGILHGGALSASAQLLSNFTAITTGSMEVTIDGTLVTLSVMNMSGAGNLNAVATIVTTALSSHGHCIWAANLNRFDIVSATTGASSTVTFASVTGSGEDVSALMGLQSSGGGSLVAGIIAETMLAAVSILATISNAWFGLSIAIAAPANSDILAVAGFIEGSNASKFLVATSQDPNCLLSSSTSDLAYELQAGAFNYTACQYSSSSPYAAVSLFARQATVDFTAQNSTITLMFKSEPGITAETLTETQAAALKTKNCNVFVNYSNSTAVIQWGTVASGQYIDTIVGAAWLLNALQTQIFNLLYTNTTKILQTDAGVGILVNGAEVIMDQAVNNALLAPGVWPINGPTIGPVTPGRTLPKGYFCYASPVATQAIAARNARQAPPIQIAALLGGAIHQASCIVNLVN